MRRKGKGPLWLASLVLAAALVVPALEGDGRAQAISDIRASQLRESGITRVNGRWVRRPMLSSVAEASFRGAGLDTMRAGARRRGRPNWTNDIQVNQDFSERPQNETTIAINPANRRNVIGGANDYRNGDALPGFYASFDKGLTWRDGLIARVIWPDGSSSDGGGDPVVYFDTEGTAYFAYIQFNRTDGRNMVGVSRSFNGGLTWSRADTRAPGTGVVVAETDPESAIFHDKEWMTVDRSGGAHDGRVYVTWTRFDFSDGYVASPIYLAYSDDQGRNFTIAGEVNGKSKDLCEFQSDGETDGSCDENQFSVPVLLPNGRVAIAFENYQNESEWNPAGDFDSQYLVTIWDPDTNQVEGPYHAALLRDGLTNYPLNNPVDQRQTVCKANFRLNSAGNLAYNPANKGLYIVFSDNRRGDFFPFPTYVNPVPTVPASNDCPDGLETDTNIFIIKSGDGGKTWSDPTLIARRRRGDQWFPWVDIAPSGRIDVVYFDRSDDPDNKYVHASMSSSKDGGATWSHLRVSERKSDMDWAFGFGRFIGDYNGIAVTNTSSYPFWTDARYGTPDIRHSDVFVAPLQK